MQLPASQSSLSRLLTWRNLRALVCLSIPHPFVRHPRRGPVQRASVRSSYSHVWGRYLVRRCATRYRQDCVRSAEMACYHSPETLAQRDYRLFHVVRRRIQILHLVPAEPSNDLFPGTASLRRKCVAWFVSENHPQGVDVDVRHPSWAERAPSG